MRARKKVAGEGDDTCNYGFSIVSIPFILQLCTWIVNVLLMNSRLDGTDTIHTLPSLPTHPVCFVGCVVEAYCCGYICT